MAGLDWLIARPVAHRGLHDAQKGVIENTPSAFAAAIAGGYGIECDLQVSADGEAMVHHDDVLGRLTAGDGRLDALTAAELKRVPFKATGDRMITLTELCELVAGRTHAGHRTEKPVRRRPAAVVAARRKVLAGYRGPVALMSFDPAPDRGRARDRAAAAARPGGGKPRLFAAGGRPFAAARDAAGVLRAGPSRAPAIHRIFGQRPARDAADGHAQGLGLPLLTWTVRTADQRRTAERYADQMIFEGFRP